MTASSPTSATAANPPSANSGKSRAQQATGLQPSTSTSSPSQTSCPSFNSSLAFQQVKQTQASLARLCRVQQLQQQQPSQSQHQNAYQGGQSQQNQSSLAKSDSGESSQQQPQRPTTFVDCLIRRFKNCFSEDFCTVPVFVVGNLSPGSDGTHLILPPCVSLGRQSINRFSSPKNLRLMNSIRESCRSIEELDLGGNKLTDLIEVYKILQCTPNLKFLNLSENDLSRSSPVAMAPTVTSSPNTGQPPLGGSGPSVSQSPCFPSPWSSGSTAQSGQQQQRSCLAPLNQNQQQQTIMTRRHHSSLGQSAASHHQQVQATANSNAIGGSVSGLNSNRSIAATGTVATAHSAVSDHHQVHLRTRQTTSRVAEARRLAAANALAQSKKTSSLVASKLANSATAGGSGGASSGANVGVGGSCNAFAKHHQLAAGAAACRGSLAARGGNSQLKADKTSMSGRLSAGQRHQSATVSTMHLARSLSSLSAKDVRTTSSSLGRLTAAHCRSGIVRRDSASMRKGGVDTAASSSAAAAACQRDRRSSTIGVIKSAAFELTAAAVSSANERKFSAPSAASGTATRNVAPRATLTSSSSLQKLFVAGPTIVEADDVEMGAIEQNAVNCSQLPAQQNATSGNYQQQHNFSSQQSHQKTGIQTLATTCNKLTTISNSSALTQAISTSNQSTNFRRTFESIKALALNNTGCQWRVVCSILSRMPNLEELHLSLNNYERIDLDPNEFKHFSLKRLYLCNNPKLTNWEELDKLLSAFPSLQALSIADCNISQIPDNLDRASEWRKLCGLNINGWPIKEWPVIERLNQLPSLIDLRCRNLEILSTIDEPRHHLIARLPKLQRLNGSEIEEREDAEKTFLRFFMINSHLERPSRFHELMQIHGEIGTVDVDVDLSPPSHAQIRVVHLNRNFYRKENEDDILMSEDFLTKLMDNVDCGQQQENRMDVADSSTTAPTSSAREAVEEDVTGPVRLFKDKGHEVVALDVDLRQTVRKFKSTMAELFNLDKQNIILYYIDHEMVGLMGPELIKHNQKKLWNYNVQDGDQFIVEER